MCKNKTLNNYISSLKNNQRRAKTNNINFFLVKKMINALISSQINL